MTITELIANKYHMKQPQISVVIPLFNKAASVGATLDSVCAQTFKDFEVVIVDDGSTDGSAQAVTPYLNNQFRLIPQKNGGVSAARNRGMEEARAAYVAFLDADDLWMPDFLETITDLIEKYPGAGIYATAYLVDDGRTRIYPRMAKSIANREAGRMPDYFFVAASGYGQPFSSSSACMERKAALNLGGFRHGLKHGEDRDMWARIALEHDVVYSPRALAVYRLEAENKLTRKMSVLEPWPFHEDFQKKLEEGYLSPHIANDIRELCARVDLQHAAGNLVNPDRKALKQFLRGIKTKRFWKRKLFYSIVSYLPISLIGRLRALNMLIKKIRRVY